MIFKFRNDAQFLHHFCCFGIEFDKIVRCFSDFCSILQRRNVLLSETSHIQSSCIQAECTICSFDTFLHLFDQSIQKIIIFESVLKLNSQMLNGFSNCYYITYFFLFFCSWLLLITRNMILAQCLFTLCNIFWY